MKKILSLFCIFFLATCTAIPAQAWVYQPLPTNITGKRITLSDSTTSTSSYTSSSVYLAPIITGATSSTYSAFNSAIQYNSASDTSGAVNGISVTAEDFAQGSANQLSGIRATAKTDANGGAYTNTASIYAGLFEADVSGTSSFNHAIGIKINQPTDNGNVNYQSGLYIADQTNAGTGTITGQDAIHIEGVSGTDTINVIGFGNGSSNVNAKISSPTTNTIKIDGTSGITSTGAITVSAVGAPTGSGISQLSANNLGLYAGGKLQATAGFIGDGTNYIQIGGAAANGNVVLNAQGTNGNIPFVISPRGSGYFGSSKGITATGTKFTITGCSVGATVGGSTGGTFVSGTTGTCTVTITMAGASGAAAPNGWSCWANDETTPADLIHETGSNATTATLSGTTVANDVIDFGCMGF